MSSPSCQRQNPGSPSSCLRRVASTRTVLHAFSLMLRDGWQSGSAAGGDAAGRPLGSWLPRLPGAPQEEAWPRPPRMSELTPGYGVPCNSQHPLLPGENARFQTRTQSQHSEETLRKQTGFPPGGSVALQLKFQFQNRNHVNFHDEQLWQNTRKKRELSTESKKHSSVDNTSYLRH